MNATIGLAILGLLCLLSLPLLVEWRSHGQRLAGLRLRVHVHGTRGKTSLTRDIARCLRQRGLRTLARTTGDAAEWILPDGTAVPWKRMGPGRVLEYIAIVRRAAALGCDALVVECMALQPETVHVAAKLLDAHCIVVTNTRPDHQEVMGLTAKEVASVFVNLLPPEKSAACHKSNPVVVVQQDAGAAVLVDAARKRGCRVVVVPESEALFIPPWERSGALAKRVEQALFEVGPRQSGVLISPTLSSFTPISPMPIPKHTHQYLDLFSINDVESASEVLHGVIHSAEPALLCLPWVALLATRQDRPLRSRSFATWAAAEPLLRYVLPTGSHLPYTWLCLPSDRRLPWRLCVSASWRGPAWTLEALQKTMGPCVVVGLGNAHGQGERYRRFMQSEIIKEAAC